MSVGITSSVKWRHFEGAVLQVDKVRDGLKRQKVVIVDDNFKLVEPFIKFFFSLWLLVVIFHLLFIKIKNEAVCCFIRF